MHALQFGRHPARFFLLVAELNDANLFAFRPLGAQELLGKVRAHRVLPDHLRGHAQNVRGRAVIFRQADAEFSRVLAGLPRREFLEEKVKARERGATKTVDRLVVVADDKPVPPAVRLPAGSHTAGNLRPKPARPGSARKTPRNHSGIARARPDGGIDRASTARDSAAAGSNGPRYPAPRGVDRHLSAAFRRRSETLRASLLFRARRWPSPPALSFRPLLSS